MRRHRALLALFAVGCAPKSPSVLLAETKLPPARVTTKSELVLQCSPTDAEVELDGVPQGTCDDFDGAPKGLALASKGFRRVSVKKRGYLPWESVVETDGTRVTMNVTLISSGGSP